MNNMTVLQTNLPAAPRNPAEIYLASLSPGSRRTMLESLNNIARFLGAAEITAESGRELTALSCPWEKLTYQDTVAVRAWLAAQYAPATGNKMLAALKGVLRRAWLMKLMDADEYQRAVNIDRIAGVSAPAGRYVTGGELAALMDVCAADDGPAGARDAALIAVLYLTGLRRSSVVALDFDDYDPETGDLVVRVAKGRKAYIAYLIAGQAIMDDWLSYRIPGPGPLFLPINKGGNIAWRRMSDHAVYKMLCRRCDEAGLEHLSPHDLRRTMASDLLAAGVDIVTVQKLMNHADPKQTSQYDRRDSEVRRAAAGMIRLPWKD